MAKRSIVLLTTIFYLFAAGAAFSHQFKVALVIPAGSDEGKQFRQGFMLATTERDSHANEESDGHLGGLDVYVSTYESSDMNSAAFKQKINAAISDDGISIMVLEGPDEVGKNLAKMIGSSPVALLRPGQTPFANTQSPAVAAFIANYKRQYETDATQAAARGYNAAQRIEFAVRPVDSAQDTELLNKVFQQTADQFDW